VLSLLQLLLSVFPRFGFSLASCLRDSRGVAFEMETMRLAKATAVSTYDRVGDQCDCGHDFR
jgi:hypothetical protein